ncbi:MAG: hypothetical protein WB816_00105 [Methylocystis sp.]
MAVKATRHAFGQLRAQIQKKQSALARHCLIRTFSWTRFGIEMFPPLKIRPDASAENNIFAFGLRPSFAPRPPLAAFGHAFFRRNLYLFLFCLVYGLETHCDEWRGMRDSRVFHCPLDRFFL